MMTMELFIIYIIISYMFTIKFKKFIMTLISVEFLMLMSGIILMLNMNSIKSNFLIIYFLVFMVSESVMGISLLILMSRIKGNDSTLIMNMTW